VLQRRDERELQRLALLVASVRGRIPALEPEALVRIRLEPDRLDERLADVLAWPAGRAVADRQRALRPARVRVAAHVRRDLVQPGAKGAATPEPGKASPRAQQRLLESVVRIMDRAQHPVAVRVQLAAMALDDVSESLLLPPRAASSSSCSLSRRVDVTDISPG
jgi:hypothetical protein